MSIQIAQRLPGHKWVELGGGARPLVHPQCMGGPDINIDVRVTHDEQGRQTVDFAADFNEPLPIQSDEFDALISQFCLEHLSWRKVKGFIQESFRVLRPGAKAVFITANTEAQMRWVLDRLPLWDDHSSCILFGDMDYPENSHKNALSPAYATKLFQKAGFEKITVTPYGEYSTDMVIEAIKPLPVEVKVVIADGEVDRDGDIVDPKGMTISPALKDQIIEMKHDGKTVRLLANPSPEKIAEMQAKFAAKNKGTVEEPKEEVKPDPLAGVARETIFDKAYFGGGGKWGGYAREGYRDFPVHEITARHILARKPDSVLELACARGYVLKKIQDAGVRGAGLEISKHCVMTRACDSIHQHDLCVTPWPLFSPEASENKPFDLCYSVAFWEHVPEQYLPAMFAEMERLTKRGLHGIDFGENDDGFDKSHTTLRPKEWWQQRMPVGHEVVDKETLEKGTFPEDVLKGDGKVKLNIGSFTTMYHHGWINMDIHDLEAFAKANGYNYQRHDVRAGLPYQTGTVDLISCCHMLEHLSDKEGLSFLRECRRVLKNDGAIRIQVPDAGLLIEKYNNGTLEDYDEVNEGCSTSDTQAGKLWALLHAGHAAVYDGETLVATLEKAGFKAWRSEFRSPGHCTSLQQIQKEAMDTLPSLSLYVNGLPNFQ